MLHLPSRMLRNGWSPWHFIGAGAMALFALWMTFPAWVDIYALSADPAGKSRYIFLVPVIAVWLVWVRRRRILHCRPYGHWVGLIFIFAGGFLYGLSTHIGSPYAIHGEHASLIWTMLWHMGAVLITVGCTLTLLGLDIISRFLPAVIVLIFLVPIPRPVCNAIEMPVKVLTLELSVAVYDWFGMDASLDYSVPSSDLSPNLVLNGVAPRQDVYHGLPMVFDLFLVSWAFVFGSPFRGSVRLIILLLSPVSAILCGAAGLIATLWLYGNQTMLAQADFFHQIGSWLMLLLAFLLLTVVIRLLLWASVPVRPYKLAYDL